GYLQCGLVVGRVDEHVARAGRRAKEMVGRVVHPGRDRGDDDERADDGDDNARATADLTRLNVHIPLRANRLAGSAARVVVAASALSPVTCCAFVHLPPSKSSLM